MRFYKGKGNSGTHIGTLWTAAGAQLARVKFTNETTSGWQTAYFVTPAAIQANTTYVISYLAPRGRYADDQGYSWLSLSTTSPLAISGASPGVYAYAGSTAFPNQSWNGSNYWVDVLFQPTAAQPPPPPPSTYSISGTVSGIPSAATIQLTGDKTASTGTTGAYTFSGLNNGTYTLTASLTGYTFSPASAGVIVDGGNVTGVNFTGTAIPVPPPTVHSVTLNWDASATPTVTGYKVYVGALSGGPYMLLSQAAVSGTTYLDTSVVAGQVYYYVTTAVDASGAESAYSNEAMAVIPSP